MRSDPQTIEHLLQAGRLMHERGWVPATSGNLSLRFGSGALLSPSGVSKGALRAEALVPVDAQGRSTTGTPSAETALHLLIYRRFPEAAAVLHAHSTNAVVLSRLVEGDLELQGYELAKALRGVTDHLTAVRVPVIANEQDMALLAPRVEAAIDRSGTRWAFVLKGHGVYAWGNSVEEALRHLEALDALFGCQLLELRT
jgi:methylthioribulose-1-phosphate dehydratase